MKAISQHTSYLAYRMYYGMTSIYYPNGQPMCVIYNDCPDRCTYGDPLTQGSTIAFNILHADGSYAGHSLVESMANSQNIYLRSGGLCNSGGISTYLKVEPWQFKRNWSAGHRCGDGKLEVLNGKPTGVVRASLGAMSTIADVDQFLEFLESEFLVMSDPNRESHRSEEIQRTGLGLEVKRSNDSGFYGSGNESNRASDNSVSLSASSTTGPATRRMISAPNMRVGAKKVVSGQRSFYDHRPSTARSQTEPVYHSEPLPQQKSLSRRSVRENLRYSNESEPAPESQQKTTQKKGGFMKIFRGRNSMRSQNR
jgi:hypothetical protein